ncbi:hypothetical protein [Limnoglobus roseus]|uniref:Uncharacterized protein n=1 Tax=Limnoglobus roseus TaxID=2598579 RepID=A0A5C1AL69_9BACT|nr:hypothetical protein [Limnoglobus roseus]QEL18706.1 hypothetical protein PX52LOC_05742 [Limnoglobus roseus]
MTTGTQGDIVTRLKALLPNGWFRDSTPILDGVLNGIGWALSSVYGLASYARLQTRISTATDGFLDMISFDFFGSGLPRKTQEMDSPFRSRILAALFPEKATRHGLIRALEILTGRTPWVFEPARPADTGAYGTNTMGYGVAGAYGSLQLPFQAFVVAYRPTGQGIPFIAGYGDPHGAYGTASQIEYANPSLVLGAVTDADIYAAIDGVKPVGTIIWTRVSS